jgi:hypothetical protein
MKAEYIRLIAAQDAVLSTLREFWMDAKTPVERAKHMKRIDTSLDERSRLMRCRDAAVS